MAKRILGLDLGTNSIGWGVVDDLGGGQFELVKRGVHIFPEGVKIEKGNESSKAAERTAYRSARRLKFRRKLRKVQTLKVLSEAGYCPSLSLDELKEWQSNKVYPANPAFHDWCMTSDPKDKISGAYENPYYYRWLAATTELDLADEADRFKLGRAFYHMAQRRGFKSNRLDTTQESDGVVSKDISNLSKKMAGRTLGQYFWEDCYQQGEKIRAVHTSRDEHYLAEFEFICAKQGVSVELKEALWKAIFYQRPLKSQKGAVASCPFEPKKKRAPISHPLFEEFRMWQMLNNIKIKTLDDEQLRSLSADERDLVIPLFFRVSKAQFDFKDIAQKLTPRGQKFGYVRGRDADAHILFNYRGDQSLSGCPFSAKLKNLFGDEYKQTLYDFYCGNKQNRVGTERTADDILHEVWHVLFSFDDAEKVKEYAQGKLGLDAELADKFAKILPRQGYGALSLKAIRKILPFLRQGLIYSHAVFFANLDEVIGLAAMNTDNLYADIAKLVNEHNQYFDEVRCVNEWVREYKNSPHAFELKYDLRDMQGFEANLSSGLKDAAASICEKVRFQTLENNGNGAYAPVKRLDERVGDFLKESFGVSDFDLQKLYHPSAIETYKPAEKHSDGKFYLGDPRISSIKNPVFMRAMHRVKAVVNELLKQGIITDQTQVNVEMARELNDANRRAAIKTWQRNKESVRKNFKTMIEEDLKAAGIEREASADEILKYQLWEEQRGICVYTGKTISPSDFIGENPRFDIEHTIPRSRSCDNSQENKTLCERNYNRNVKKASIPFECPEYDSILQRIEHWQDEAERLTGLIEKKRSASRGASTKEAKDQIIQQRLVLELDRNYLREKYRRFMMEEVSSGFKNSQLVDTRIITKYARLYLRTVFSTVHTVNGKTTDDFRRCWGIEKSRDNHAHHTVDAIVAACVTRAKYDKLAEYYHEYESYECNDPSIPRKPHFPKPWDTFTEDMKNLKNEILVSHYAPNHLLKQTKKYAKVHGKRVLQQGKTARGSLHQDTFYGAIKRMEENKKGEKVEVTKYVVRKPLVDLSDKDLNKIVDDRIREIAINSRAEESRIKKEIEGLKKKKPTSDDANEALIQQQIVALESQLSGLYALPNKNGAPIPIKRVRVYSNATNPIPLKHQSKVSQKTPRPHREQYWVNNGENFCIIIYEGVGKNGEKGRTFRAFSNYSATNDQETRDAATFSKRYEPIKKNGVLLEYRYEMQPGTPVIFCDGSDLAELRNFNSAQLNVRLYLMYGIKGDDGRSKFRFHQEARLDKEQESPVSSLNVENPAPKLWISASKLDLLVGDVDFKINVLGEIDFMDKISC